jgi:hypothetical protein
MTVGVLFVGMQLRMSQLWMAEIGAKVLRDPPDDTIMSAPHREADADAFLYMCVWAFKAHNASGDTKPEIGLVTPVQVVACGVVSDGATSGRDAIPEVPPTGAEEARRLHERFFDCAEFFACAAPVTCGYAFS